MDAELTLTLNKPKSKFQSFPDLNKIEATKLDDHYSKIHMDKQKPTKQSMSSSRVQTRKINSIDRNNANLVKWKSCSVWQAIPKTVDNQNHKNLIGTYNAKLDFETGSQKVIFRPEDKVTIHNRDYLSLLSEEAVPCSVDNGMLAVTETEHDLQKQFKDFVEKAETGKHNDTGLVLHSSDMNRIAKVGKPRLKGNRRLESRHKLSTNGESCNGKRCNPHQLETIRETDHNIKIEDKEARKIWEDIDAIVFNIPKCMSFHAWHKNKFENMPCFSDTNTTPEKLGKYAESIELHPRFYLTNRNLDTMNSSLMKEILRKSDDNEETNKAVERILKDQPLNSKVGSQNHRRYKRLNVYNDVIPHEIDVPVESISPTGTVHTGTVNLLAWDTNTAKSELISSNKGKNVHFLSCDKIFPLEELGVRPFVVPQYCCQGHHNTLYICCLYMLRLLTIVIKDLWITFILLTFIVVFNDSIGYWPDESWSGGCDECNEPGTY
ncbi:hypothetical protein DPMN_117627 [Dreissena polymorpha]|uniref:Uncharacterized protein n=1 Tax=Dreissena polymorpha TaxID=45954 RepID=A0A9D4GIL4_DREPO|nr:hypothetical protein DPMN_117627 [Dreissena polymorpha]